MADQTPEQVAAAETAARSTAELKAMVEGAVKTSISDLIKEGQAKQDALKATEVAEAEAARKRTTEGANPFADLIKPSLEPVLEAAKAAEARAIGAADSVNFYTDPAHAAVIKYRPQIEKFVAEQAKRGNSITRKDAWNWLRGGELYDELSKESLAAHETKVKEAQAAATVGGSIQVPKFSKPVEQLNTDELGEALKGVPF